MGIGRGGNETWRDQIGDIFIFIFDYKNFNHLCPYLCLVPIFIEKSSPHLGRDVLNSGLKSELLSFYINQFGPHSSNQNLCEVYYVSFSFSYLPSSFCFSNANSAKMVLVYGLKSSNQR